jgi:Pyridoxamine 5'-phosphate oxidase
MPPRTPTETIDLDIYGAGAMPWSRALEALGTGALAAHVPCFLGTVRPDGRPHAAGIGVAELDGDLYFTSGPRTRKARNLAVNAACTVAVGLEGIDLVLEGRADRVAEAATLERAAALYRDDGWPARVEGDALTAPFSAPSAGAPPWHLYRFAFHTAIGVATAEPHGATRWRFAR